MTGQQPTKHCGNCGKAVDVEAIICPHCDVLLAAYEAPSGATIGTSAAIDPVQMTSSPPHGDLDIPATPPSPPATPPLPGPVAPYQSPTAQSLDELDAQKPQAATTSTTFNLPQSSPVAEAMQRTRVAADLDAQGERSTASEQGIRPSTRPVSEPLAEKERQLFGMSVKPARTTDSTAVPQPQPNRPTPPPEKRQPAAGQRVTTQPQSVADHHQNDVQQIAQQATAARPTPEQRTGHHDQPVKPSGRQNTASPNFGPMIGLFIVVILILRAFGSGAFAGFLLLSIVIIGLLWFMITIAKRTGRKTTTMPKDKNRRK